jgi:nicotinamidase-related amidase
VEQVVIPAIYRMLGVYRECRRPIVYVKTGSQLPDFSDLPAYYRGIQEHVKNKVGEPEFEIRREIAPRPIDPVIVKSTISAFKSTGIGTLLRSLDVDQAVFCGVSTNSCVDSTARDAAELGFEAIMVEDACSAANGSYHAAALTTFGRLFGSVTSSEHVCSVVAARNE